MGSTVASHEEHKEAGHSPSHFHTLAFDTTHFMQEEKENILLYFREKNNSSSAAVQPATRHVDKSRDQTNQYQNKRHRSNPSRASKKPPSPFRLPTKSNHPITKKRSTIAGDVKASARFSFTHSQRSSKTQL